eukprot:CAMPEP_0201579550 /NCGR_PEP_ID=MMETSP0190_2-20130828/27213_1 /ASSEMBLY_ACC=CAM_ASM_000263 /TAXON_ID=37353 /ORGANISM="Rosalina sp." /LENGTH=265 /DNA_ID=CAMNT_0048014159 /DNA_START=150 /DNA_END=947 /DNA_ORIENTATION=+
MYILGAENEEKGGDDTFEYVPYSTAIKQTQGSSYTQKFSEFGLRAKALSLEFESENYIFTLGGQTHYNESGDNYLPNDTFGRYIVSKGPEDGYTDNKDQQDSQRWKVGYLAQATQRCGVINYNDKYLITFGGDIMKFKKVIPQSGMIYLTPLKEDKKYGLEVKQWYELPQLKRGGQYHAIYPKGGDKIYLFNYYGKREKGKGKLYELPIKTILNELDTGLITEAETEGGYKSLHPWTDQGKTTIPDEDKGKDAFPTMGPADDDSD